MMNKMFYKVSNCMDGYKKCINGNLINETHRKTILDALYTEIHANYTYYLRGIVLCFIFDL